MNDRQSKNMPPLEKSGNLFLPDDTARKIFSLVRVSVLFFLRLYGILTRMTEVITCLGEFFSMTPIAFFLIVSSAILHASWNLLAKKYHITLPFYAAICGTAMLMWLHVQFWTPVPVWQMPWQFWASLAGSVLSDAVIYCGGLVMVYRVMDMSSAYPMMRSLPLLLTVAVTAVFGMGKPLNCFAVIGMIMVFAGCLCMPLKKFSDFNWRGYLSWNMFFVLLCACGTTGYTVFDSLCQSIMSEEVAHLAISKPVLSVSYYSTRGIFLTSTLVFMSLVIPSQRKHITEMWKECKWAPFAAGIFASVTYVLVLLSMNYVTNVSYVQVFRQLGLIVGLLAGIIILKERGSLAKFVGVFLIISGLIVTVIPTEKKAEKGKTLPQSVEKTVQ